MINKKKFFLLSTASLLVIFYLIAFFYLIKSINVSDEYRLFYIEHQLKYYLNDNDLKNKYSIGHEIDYTINGEYKNQSVGWVNTDENGSTALKESSYFFYFDNSDALNSIINFYKPVENDFDINVLLNDNSEITESIHLNKSDTKFNINIDKKILKNNSVNKVSFLLINCDAIYVNKIKL